MPYRITWEPRGVHRQYHGDVTVAQRFESFEAICRDERFDSLLYAITDYRQVGAYEVTPQATEEMAAFHVAPLITNPRLIIAAVAERADIVAAIQSFMGYGYIAAPYRVHATEELARAWIDSIHEPPPGPASPTGRPALSGDRSFDRPLQPHEALALAQLSAAQLASVDAHLLESVPPSWCRSAVVVARAARLEPTMRHLPLNCYTDRLLRLAAHGSIEVQGDLRRSRQSYVRQAAGC